MKEKDFENDFGFSAIDTNEFPGVVESKIEYQRACNMYNAILPFLESLRKNPEKDYIYWPNRKPKVDDFQKTLHDILTK